MSKHPVSLQINIKGTKPQVEFYNLNCKYPLFVAGYGAGKTETMINSALMDASHAPDALIALYAPTYDLIKLIIAPRIEAKLQEYGIDYIYNKLDSTIKTNHPQFGNFILKSLDTPERIVGYQAYRSHIDELDTLPLDQAKKAWVKILGRNRQVPKGMTRKTCFNKVNAYSTPEGYRFLHYRWVENNPNPDKYKFVKATSYSNPFLPADYIESLLESYDEKLRAAYLEGEFVNLTSGTVYYQFNRISNKSVIDVRLRQNEIHMGMDFNVGKMAAVACYKIGDEIHAICEFKNLFDTPAMIDKIKSHFPTQTIYVYPDASGAARSSNNASRSDIDLLQDAGFYVMKNRRNPRVKDRVLAVNSAFFRSKAFVNIEACPELVMCLEQQAYDDKGEPDKKNGKDHMNDAWGYLINYLMPIQKPPAIIEPTYL